MEQRHKDNRRKPLSAEDKALWNMRDKIESICVAARRADMLSATDVDYLCTLASGARFCKSGGFVNSNSVAFLSQAFERERSTVHRILRRLEDAGWIVNRTGARGQRFYSDGYHHGIDVSPILDREVEIKNFRRLRWERLASMQKKRDQLKGLKGQLRRLVERLENFGSAMLDEATALLDSIPRRFHKLTIDELVKFIESIAKLLNEASREISGHAKTQHQCCGDSKPYTDTHQSKEISNKFAHEENMKSSDTEFDIHIGDTLKLLTTDEQVLLEELVQDPHDASDVLGRLRDIAGNRFAQNGGSMEAASRVFNDLGEYQGTVLLLLVSDAAKRGAVRNSVAYAISCARKALRGQFMWGAGVRATKAKMLRHNVI